MRPDWRQVLPALAVGLALGAGLGRWLQASRRPLDPQTRHQRMVERLNRELGLAGAQRDKVAAVLEAKRSKLDALRNETRPRFEAIRREAHQEILKALEPGQVPKFEKLEAEWQVKWEKRHGRSPKP